MHQIGAVGCVMVRGPTRRKYEYVKLFLVRFQQRLSLVATGYGLWLLLETLA